MALFAYKQILRCRPQLLQFTRKFNLPEYQSKILMNEYDLAVQDFRLATSVEEAERIVAAWKPSTYVLKAQIQAGGRKLGHFVDGNGSGIQFTNNPDEVPYMVSKMIGNRLITKQTISEGAPVNEVMIAEGVTIKKERYLAIVLDRESVCPVVVTSVEGGVNIEDLAITNPDAIKKEKINMTDGLTDIKATNIAISLGFPPDSALHKTCCNQIKRLYKLFIELDCLQVEINPFGETQEGRLVNMDAKFSFDCNATYRQPRVAALASQSRKLEVEAAGSNSLVALELEANAHGLNYIGLSNGNIGCMVNGAGLAMATMDILRLYEGKAANFLDLGGRANKSDVEFALKTLTANKQVRCILVNIFGGIVNCHMVAAGIVEACNRYTPKVPIVVRLEGTNALEGRKVLESSGLSLHVVGNMEEAAVKACELSR